MSTLVGALSTQVQVRVFVASPSDVPDERATAFTILEALPKDPLLEGRVALQVAAWDKNGVGVPMQAEMAPQDAILHHLPTPAECDVFVLILWSRIGTPLDRTSEAARNTAGISGTVSEYRDALEAWRVAGRPQTLIYRRKEDPPPTLHSDPDREEKLRQWDAVQAFFAEFRNPDGSFNSGYNEYENTSEFGKKLDAHLRHLLRNLLGLDYLGRGRRRRPSPDSPFPGLHPFTAANHAHFFGRGIEADELVRRCGDPVNRFVAVVGASGVGKSSVVAAGLMPRLKAGAVEGSAEWMYVRCIPGEARDPFLSLAFGIRSALGEGTEFRAGQLAEELALDPSIIGTRLPSILALTKKPPASEVFVFIDQFEELFTLCDPARVEPFITLLRRAVETRRMRIVVTLRADFYARCTEFADLAALLRSGSFPLAPPGAAAMVEMITQPAERADLAFDKDLPERIMNDMGTDRAALPLLAFALRRLWDARDDDGRLTSAAYDSFGGVRGVIRTTAEEVFTAVDDEAQQSLGAVFAELVSLQDVDGQLTVTRRRVPLESVKRSSASSKLIDTLLKHRLLVVEDDLPRHLAADAEQDPDHLRDKNIKAKPVISVAHEALLSHWSRLSEWIDKRKQGLWQIQTARAAAAEWDRHERSDEFLWSEKRLAEAGAIVSELQPQLTDLERRFLGVGSAADLVDELHDRRTGHRRRAYIGDRLAQMGDARPGVGLRADGLPDIEWCFVPRGTAFVLPQQAAADVSSQAPEEVTVEAFEISKYPISWLQFRAFIDHPQGYRHKEWWAGLTMVEPGEQRWQHDNCPAENVSWYDAVAFCRWLSALLHEVICLPSEQQWVRAASGELGGVSPRRYPWGSEWNGRLANTQESGLSRAIAVGMYPDAASPFGVHDLAGNVYEWCSDEYDDPNRRVGKDGPRVLKGGAWSCPVEGAQVLNRDRDLPDFREYHDHGLRVCRAG